MDNFCKELDILINNKKILEMVNFWNKNEDLINKYNQNQNDMLNIVYKIFEMKHNGYYVDKIVDDFPSVFKNQRLLFSPYESLIKRALLENKIDLAEFLVEQFPHEKIGNCFENDIFIKNLYNGSIRILKILKKLSFRRRNWDITLSEDKYTETCLKKYKNDKNIIDPKILKFLNSF
jgi:hypothetical protein